MTDTRSDIADDIRLDGEEGDDELFARMFSSFDGIGASSAVKERTLQAIGIKLDSEIGVEAVVESAKRDVLPSETEAVPVIAEASPIQQAASRKEAGSAQRHGKPGRHGVRILRFLAAAACVCALSIGGVAYATPSAYISVESGESTVELSVNRFGIVLSADSSDESGAVVLREADIRHEPYGESLERIIRAYEEQADGGDRFSPGPFAIHVRADDLSQQDEISERSRGILEGIEPNEAPSPDGDQQNQYEESRPDDLQNGSRDAAPQNMPSNSGEAVPNGRTEPEVLTEAASGTTLSESFA